LTLSPEPKVQTPLVPVLLIWGEEDPLSPVEAGERVMESIRGSKMERIANAAHMPHLEAPDVFVFQVKQFLKSFRREALL
jgi:pimeloyl-ACP methyl ester carboxylesterase